MATQANQPIRWGILGTGGIAQKFAEGLAVLDDAELIAVGSRSAATAETFGARYNIPHRHASYAALASDPDVDVIYISTPHPKHKEDSCCACGGKAVLCEKPFTINAGEAAEVIAFARAQHLFLMEAMWIRFLPLMVRLRELLSDGTIGEVRMVHADFSFRAPFDPQAAYSTGAWAAGRYSMRASILSRWPRWCWVRRRGRQRDSHRGTTGVDEQTAILQRYRRPACRAHNRDPQGRATGSVDTGHKRLYPPDRLAGGYPSHYHTPTATR